MTKPPCPSDGASPPRRPQRRHGGGLPPRARASTTLPPTPIPPPPPLGRGAVYVASEAAAGNSHPPGTRGGPLRSPASHLSPTSHRSPVIECLSRRPWRLATRCLPHPRISLCGRSAPPLLSSAPRRGRAGQGGAGHWRRVSCPLGEARGHLSHTAGRAKRKKKWTKKNAWATRWCGCGCECLGCLNSCEGG